jgi:hypothetical protein
MKMLRHWFLDHPRSVGETYFEHQQMAFGFSVRLFVASCACLVHGLIPCLFERSASRTIATLNERMVLHRAANDTREERSSAERIPGTATSQDIALSGASVTAAAKPAMAQPH